MEYKSKSKKAFAIEKIEEKKKRDGKVAIICALAFMAIVALASLFLGHVI